MSDSSEFRVCGAENARHANSVSDFAADNIGCLGRQMIAAAKQEQCQID